MIPPQGAGIDLSAIRARLAGARGRVYWRGVEELAETPAFLDHLRGEFPRLAAAADAALDRRRFVQLMAASMALAGLGGCGPEPLPDELLPYVEDPPGVVPGLSNYYATAFTLGGFAEGVLLRHAMGRPLKVEGNPDHPASLGAASAFGQASILDLYDPDRMSATIATTGIRTWEALVAALSDRRQALLQRGGEGLRLLTGAVTSPTLAAQIGKLTKAMPAVRWHEWEPLGRDNIRAGAQLAFGRPVDTVLHLDKADVIVAVEGEFLTHAPGSLRYARDFAARRRAGETGGKMSRLYALESTPTLAGSMADHRWPLRPDDLDAALRALAAALGAGPEIGGAKERFPWIDAVAGDLREHQGRALVHVGRELAPELHALAHSMNDALGAPGATLDYIDPVESQAERHSIADLTRDMRQGKVDTVVIIGGNPVYTAPADLGFAEALARVPLSVAVATHVNETALRCNWAAPLAHQYEAWSDARAFDGTATIQQPQIRPLYNGRSAHEMMAVLLGEPRPDPYGLVRDEWRRRASEMGKPDFDTFWIQSLRKGVVEGTAAKRVDVSLRKDLADKIAPAKSGSGEGDITILFRADPAVWDGSHANNAWLQEFPRPLTRLTWDNAVLVAPATAERLGVGDEDVLALRAGTMTVAAPVYVMPGQAPDCLTLPLGYGQKALGKVGAGVGFDAYPLRVAGAPWQRAGVKASRTGEQYQLASTQHHQVMEGRELVKEGTLGEFLKDPHFLEKREKPEEKADASLYPPFRYEGHAWAMAINLDSCIGCGACVLACQSENNIATVGKEEVVRGRAMHWLRIDRYYVGPLDQPEFVFQPVPCMHCEKAPCEVVCPVHATVHDSEGLNLMVYNRCIGTRFCSNNCPYKVRRFNFFGYSYEEPRPPESWNPDVTVRGRGVMEKCTYCIQRIREATIAADRDGTTIKDGTLLTACQQTCPTQAIVFGDKNDPASKVSERKSSPLDYELLKELNTRPRTTYQARLRNPNPALGEV